MASDGGKGSAPRPYSVGQDTFADNWERTFGKKKTESIPMPGTIGGAKLIFKDDDERSDSISTDPTLDQG
jgi:hypothetical protein